jgi:hypothetical protein
LILNHLDGFEFIRPKPHIAQIIQTGEPGQQNEQQGQIP